VSALIDLKTFTNASGNLTVIEKVLPFEIKRVFFIYGVDDSVRGKHRHRRTRQAAVCIRGSCTIYNQLADSEPTEVFNMQRPDRCLILEPEDYHWMAAFSSDCILMIFASEYFDPGDYIFEPYRPIS
jgi:hypothetical protein